MGSNPYVDLPKTAFWRSAVAESSPFDLEGLYRPKFAVSRTTRIAAAGSCFAQHLSRHLRQRGCHLLDVEPAPAWLQPDRHAAYGYSIYSARYGNIYTLQQLAQLAEEVAGLREPAEICWWRQGRVYDALRPAVEPEGLDSAAELRMHRAWHLERVRELFRSMDLLVFTLGLTEAWVHKASATVYPTAPGVHAGDFDRDRFGFVNFDYRCLQEAFDRLLDALRVLRATAGPPRMLLTVSPIPLTATASGGHVLAASTYSKATLRAFAGDLTARHDFVDYFPSYEIVTNPAARGVFFDGNLRSVRPQGVEAAMRIFFGSHPGLGVMTDDPGPPQPEVTRLGEQVEDPQCEEALLEAFAP